jgi:predicted  nucleic acid-binding Zn-ribbon protein
MENDFITKYIERINNNVSDLTKKLMFVETQLEVANENLIKKDKDFEERWRQFEDEQNQQFYIKLDDSNTRWLKEVENIKSQRASLQDECNELRTRYNKLEEAYNILTTKDDKPSRRKKNISTE